MEEKEEQKELDNITGANTEESRIFIKPEPAQEDELASIHWPSEDIGCQFSKICFDVTSFHQFYEFISALFVF